MYFCFLDYYYDQEERTDEEGEPTFSEDEAVSQRGLRRSQSVKISRSKIRKDVSVMFHTGDSNKTSAGMSVQEKRLNSIYNGFNYQDQGVIMSLDCQHTCVRIHFLHILLWYSLRHYM